jgi:hypothetical protein
MFSGVSPPLRMVGEWTQFRKGTHRINKKKGIAADEAKQAKVSVRLK